MKTSTLRTFYDSLTVKEKDSFRKKFIKETQLHIQTLYGYLRSGYGRNPDREIKPIVAERILEIAQSVAPGKVSTLID